MDAEAEAFLLAHDRPAQEEWESPKEWNHEAYTDALRRVKKMHQMLEAHFGIAVSLDDGHQDSSHFASLGFTLNDAHYDVRFSNFGDLAMVVNWNTEQPDEITVEVERQLTKCGWVVIPYALLLERYTGQARQWWQTGFRNSTAGQNFTWVNRFFDYL